MPLMLQCCSAAAAVCAAGAQAVPVVVLQAVMMILSPVGTERLIFYCHHDWMDAAVAVGLPMTTGKGQEETNIVLQSLFSSALHYGKTNATPSQLHGVALEKSKLDTISESSIFIGYPSPNTQSTSAYGGPPMQHEVRKRQGPQPQGRIELSVSSVFSKPSEFGEKMGFLS